MGHKVLGDTPYTSKNGKGDTRPFESTKVPKVYFTRVNQPKSTSPKAVPRQYQRYCLGTALGLVFVQRKSSNEPFHHNPNCTHYPGWSVPRSSPQRRKSCFTMDYNHPRHRRTGATKRHRAGYRAGAGSEEVIGHIIWQAN